MAMSKTYKQWLIALILVIFLVLFFEWLVNHNRKSANRYNQNNTQREQTK
jgi:flagellar biogenesis protein FliO